MGQTSETDCLVVHEIAELLCLDDDDAGDNQHGDQAAKGAQNDEGAFLGARHSKASFLNSMRV